VIAVLAHALKVVGREGVMAVALPEKVGSRRVMERAGDAIRRHGQLLRV
jgi:hypothetical protein